MSKDPKFLDVNQLIRHRRLNCLFSETDEVKEKKLHFDKRLYQNLKNKLKMERNISFKAQDSTIKLEALQNFKRTLIYQTNLKDIKRQKDTRLEEIQNKFKFVVDHRKPFKSYVDYLKQKKMKVLQLLTKNQKFKEMLDGDLDIWFKKYEQQLVAKGDSKSVKDAIFFSENNATQPIMQNELYEEVLWSKMQEESQAPKTYWLSLPSGEQNDKRSSLLMEANQMLHPYIVNDERTRSIDVKRMSARINDVLNNSKAEAKQRRLSVCHHKSQFCNQKVILNTEGKESFINEGLRSSSCVIDPKNDKKVKKVTYRVHNQSVAAKFKDRIANLLSK